MVITVKFATAAVPTDAADRAGLSPSRPEPVAAPLQVVSAHQPAEVSTAEPSSVADILLRLGARPQHIRYALERQRTTSESLPAVMRDFGFVSQETVARALSTQFNLPYFPISGVDAIDPAAFTDISLPRFDGYVPIGADGNNLHLLVAVSEAERASAARNAFYERHPQIYVASAQTVQMVYRRYFADTAAQFDTALKKFDAAVKAGTSADQPGLIQDIFGTLLRHACYSGASDLYLYKSEAVGVIKLKVQGIGHIFRSIPMDTFDLVMNKLVTENAKADDLRRRPQEATIEFSSDDQRARFEDIVVRYGFRLQLSETQGRRSAVVRILDKQSTEADFGSLGFDANTAGQIQRISSFSHGLFLVVGPTGSGKTTTLYAILKQIDPVERTIFTIENPIEYRHGLWLQNQTPRDMAEGEGVTEILNSALRSAPDVIFFGEVRRNVEVANTLIDAANTGHLVFSTLHTNSAALAITRLKTIGVDMASLAAVLEGVLAQRLVRVLCPACRQPDARLETATELNAKWLGSAPKTPFRASPAGCPHCRGTGFRGRQIIYEFLDVASIRPLVEAGAPPSQLAAQGIKEGHSMWANGVRLVATGITSLDELIRVAKSDK